MLNERIPSVHLAHSYRDSWSDYQRSLKSRSFPVWDHVVITASNEHQAEGYRQQLKARKNLLPRRTRFTVIPDERGERVGSGGATLNVLRFLHNEYGSFSGKRFLVIHSGGDSKRVPQYSALGKLFSPVPHLLPDGRSSTLFDELLITMSTVPERVREGMLLLSGDVLLLFNPLAIDYSGKGAACISFQEDVGTGKDHGVFLRGEDGCVRCFLHKQSVETLGKAGAVSAQNTVDIDTGTIILGVDVLNALFSLLSENGVFSEEKYEKYVNSTVRLSLYGDFQYPMASDSTLELFYEEAPEGAFSPALRDARTDVWNVLRPFRIKLLKLSPAKFIHFGTTEEVLRLMSGGVDRYADLGWSSRVNCSMETGAGCNSVIDSGAHVGENCYFEASHVRKGAVVGNGVILSCIDVPGGTTVPDGVVLHGLRLKNGKFVCRIYGVSDNPKASFLFGTDLSRSGTDLWNPGDEHNLWNARLYPACDTAEESVSAAVALYRMIKEGRPEEVLSLQDRKSLCSGFLDADPKEIMKWNSRMNELIRISSAAKAIENGCPVTNVRLSDPLSPFQQQWLDARLKEVDYSTAMRLHYYIGTVLGEEDRITEAFDTLSSAILSAEAKEIASGAGSRIVKDRYSVSLPLRVNWGGGWSDTPPYCNENGGTVLNAAILLNGKRPVTVTLTKLPEKKIILESHDMDMTGTFRDLSELQNAGDPFDPFALPKAVFLACGIVPPSGGTMEELLDRLGGGFRMVTDVSGVPKGSGLGTSSILASACVKALFGFLGISHTNDDLYRIVLCAEQIMSTGGGWQDQVGGITDGIKYSFSHPGLRQNIRVEPIRLSSQTLAELNERFAVINTDQRRLARNLLRDVVGRYFCKEPNTLFALKEVQKTATLMRSELERDNVDDFALLLSRHWELSKMIDADSTNPLIDRIFESIDDLIAGKMICGAGGGGFLQVILKKGITKNRLSERLKAVFPDTNVDVWDCSILGME